MDISEARKAIEESVNSKQMVLIIGDCYVEYLGRACSKLPKGKRLLMIKGDSSFAIHQNKKLRPANYMMNAVISARENDGVLEVTAIKKNPKETLKAFFEQIHFIHTEKIEETNDIRLFGSEKELSNELMNDLEFIEKGLRPLKQESPLRKGMIDILAEDSDGKLVVIELKRRQADYSAVTQLQRYMKEVEKIKNRQTRGILVAPEIRKNAKELLERYGLEFFELNFEVREGGTEIKGHKSKQTKLI